MTLPAVNGFPELLLEAKFIKFWQPESLTPLLPWRCSLLFEAPWSTRSLNPGPAGDLCPPHTATRAQHPSLQYQGQQEHINTNLMLNPILSLTAKFYRCSALLILHWELCFKMESRLYAYKYSFCAKRNTFPTVIQVRVSEMLKACFPTPYESVRPRFACCWLSPKPHCSTGKRGAICLLLESSGANHQRVNRNIWRFNRVDKPRAAQICQPWVRLTEPISFANLC